MSSDGSGQREIIKKLSRDFRVKGFTIRRWLHGDSPYGRNLGRIEDVSELFYVLGALFGDGCIYFWRHMYQVWIHGEPEFVQKYAKKLSACLPGHREIPFYSRKDVNVSWVLVSNAELFFLFRRVRSDLPELLRLLNKGDRNLNILQFIEGFFDAEGCIKIINDRARRIPKICLDLTNTNLQLQELVALFLHEQLAIRTGMSIQRPGRANRKTAYHLRIYSKGGVRKFLENIQTIKMKGEKSQYVKRWLEKENWKGKPLPGLTS